MVTIIDYRLGNSGSIVNILNRVGVDAVLTSDPARIAAAEKLVLPGVGAFDDGMRNLRELGLLDPLRDAVRGRGVPLLGICLGMQLLADSSEEGVEPGLGFVPGRVRRFAFPERARKVPHMGWNTVACRRRHPALPSADEDARYYFVHSYYFDCADPADVLAETDYGLRFVSAVARGNIAGVQFHPEKSLRWGMELFERFARHV